MSFWTPTCSFGGIAFSLDQSQLGGPGYEAEVDDEVNSSNTDIPGGDISYTQIGGRKSQEPTWQLVIPAANLTSLKALLGQQRTLVLHGSSYTATLIKIGGKKKHAASAFAVATATWIV